MHSRDIIIEALGRVQRVLSLSLEGLTPEQLTYRPGPQSNSIAWLAWHLTRVQDHHLSDLAGREQAWTADGWHAKFNKPAEPLDTGQGYTPEHVAEVRPSSAQILLDYYNAVYARSQDYLKDVHHDDMEAVINEPQYNPLPTVGVRLVSVVSDNTQHAGQIAYVRGLIEGKRWYPS